MSLYDLFQNHDGERFQIIKFELTAKEVEFEKMRAIFSRTSHEIAGLEAGFYVKLVDKKKNDIVMSDTWMEWQTNLKFMSKANGNVIIAGLGIGMIIREIQDLEEVTSITVIEKYQEVIDITTKYVKFNDKVKIICADIFDYIPDKKYDTVYFDIWNTISGDNYPETITLHKKFKNNINKANPDNYLDSWRVRSFKAFYDEDIKQNRYNELYNRRNQTNEGIANDLTGSEVEE